MPLSPTFADPTGRSKREGYVLCRAVGEGQAEGGLLVNCRRDRADIRVVAKDAQKMCLPIFPYIAIDPQTNAGRGLLRDAHVFKQPEPQMCILHRLRPPS